jgi:outer membrane receptor protein involved in Fe transport
MGNLTDELTSVGVTCHWENRLSERFTLVLNGTLQDADFSSGTRHEGYAPRELYNLDLRFFPVRGQTFDLLLTHQSSVWPLQYGYDPFLATEVPGYNRVDLTWRRELPRGALAVTVRNLFDDEVLGVTRGVPQYAPELGREFFVSYTVKF